MNGMMNINNLSSGTTEMLLRIKLNLRNSIEIKSLEINQKLKRESIHTQFVLLVTELVGRMKLGVKMLSLVLTLILMLMLMLKLMLMLMMMYYLTPLTAACTVEDVTILCSILLIDIETQDRKVQHEKFILLGILRDANLWMDCIHFRLLVSLGRNEDE